MRYAHDSGFMYVHTLQIMGLVELLNSRDLTDCGFNDNTYTIRQFVTRLFSLSSFEFSLNIVGGNNIDLDQMVEYIKTFENYTLYSALREFFDGYNCAIKATFTGTTNLSTFNLVIIPKTGDFSLDTIGVDTFDDTRLTKVIDKNSFGTTVVTNAENVISTKAKTFPANGTVKATGENYKYSSNFSDVCIRLPNNVYKVNWVRMYTRIWLLGRLYRQGGGATIPIKYVSIDVGMNDEEIRNAIDEIVTWASGYDSTLVEDIDALKEQLIQQIDLARRITFKDGVGFDAINKRFVIKKGYDINIPVFEHAAEGGRPKTWKYVLMPKNERDMLPNTWQAMYWERGSDKIKGFEFFNEVKLANRNGTISCDQKYTDLGVGGDLFSSYNTSFRFRLYTNGLMQGAKAQTRFRIEAIDNDDPMVSFVVNYVPMSDLKVKVDNQRDKKDIQLYNQNGKITDSVAFSKLINSYSKEISSDEITRYKQYYSFADVPKCGQLVNVNDEFYVINNISCDFIQNEINSDNEVGYFIECEITMSKSIAAKSLMTNPNTNIRDYMIPQNFNVKRKQLYRDYYELGHSGLGDNYWYLPLRKCLNLSYNKQQMDNYLAVIKLHYSDNLIVGDPTSNNFYYQLDTTRFELKKQVIIVTDFKDNNIIGYGSQNIYSGFDITKIFIGSYRNITTPISYVDDKGQFESATIQFANESQVQSVYETIKTNHSITYPESIYNSTVFIDSEIYDEFEASGNHDFTIEEQTYNKDATEVPVFEYCMQVANSDDVIVGENILNTDDYDFYMYSYKLVAKNTVNENNYGLLQTEDIEKVSSGIYRINNAVWFDTTNLNEQQLWFELYDHIDYDINSGQITKGTIVSPLSIDKTKDLVITKHLIDSKTNAYINEGTMVVGNRNEGEKTFTINLQDGQEIASADIQVAQGFRSDSPYYDISVTQFGSQLVVSYIIGGQDYDDTEASGTLEININAGSSTTESYGEMLSGTRTQGNKTLQVHLESNQTLDNVSLQLSSISSGDLGAYATLVSFNANTGEIVYALGQTIANAQTYGELSYDVVTSSGTRTFTQVVYGNKTQTQTITIPLAAGEVYDSATMSGITLLNNNTIGSFANITDITHVGNVWQIHYTLGQTVANANIGAELTYSIKDVGAVQKKDLVFVIKNMNNIYYFGNELLLYVNHWKLD